MMKKMCFSIPEVSGAALLLTLFLPGQAMSEPLSLQSWKIPEHTSVLSDPTFNLKSELGKKLFFDPRLSGNQSTSCANCHHPGLGWADGQALRISNETSRMGRHTPSIMNVVFFKSYFWDGRASSLEQQFMEHTLSPAMQNNSARHIVSQIASVPGYRAEFKDAFGDDVISFERIAAAVAAFERTLISSNSRFDHYIHGKENALNEQQKRGYQLFTGKAMCSFCHYGPALTDTRFHNIGLNTIDPGRFEITNRAIDQYAFKTPSLRNVGMTPPYMHDGSKSSLEEVLLFYNRGGDKTGGGNELLALNLSGDELQDILAFLGSLTGEIQYVTVPMLPRAPGRQVSLQNPQKIIQKEMRQGLRKEKISSRRVNSNDTRGGKTPQPIRINAPERQSKP